MTGVVIKIDGTADRKDWENVLKTFGIIHFYELPGLGNPLTGSIKLERLLDLVKFQAADVVIVQPHDGDFVQGDQSLLEFEHPAEAIYVFGGTMTRLTEADLRGVKMAAKIYIPVGDLFPAQAGAVVLWDRLSKAGT